MKKVRNFLVLLLAALMLTVFVGCNPDEGLTDDEGGTIVLKDLSPVKMTYELKANSDGVFHANPGYRVWFMNEEKSDYQTYGKSIEYHYTVGKGDQIPEDPTLASPHTGNVPIIMGREDINIKVFAVVPGKTNPTDIKTFTVKYNADFRFRPTMFADAKFETQLHSAPEAGEINKDIDVYIKNNEDLEGKIFYTTDPSLDVNPADMSAWTELTAEIPVKIEAPKTAPEMDEVKILRAVFVGTDGKTSDESRVCYTWLTGEPNQVFVVQASLNSSNAKYFVLYNSGDKTVNLGAYSFELDGKDYALRGTIGAKDIFIVANNNNIDSAPKQYKNMVANAGEKALELGFGNKWTGSKSIELKRVDEVVDIIPAMFSTSGTYKNKEVALRKYVPTLSKCTSEKDWIITRTKYIPYEASFKVYPYVNDEAVTFYSSSDVKSVIKDGANEANSKAKFGWLSRTPVYQGDKEVFSGAIPLTGEVVLKVNGVDRTFTFTAPETEVK